MTAAERARAIRRAVEAAIAAGGTSLMFEVPPDQFDAVARELRAVEHPGAAPHRVAGFYRDAPTSSIFCQVLIHTPQVATTDAAVAVAEGERP